MSAAHATDGRPPQMVCLGDPCWCGGHRAAARVNPFPWTPEREAAFFAERAAWRAKRAEQVAASKAVA